MKYAVIFVPDNQQAMAPLERDFDSHDAAVDFVNTHWFDGWQQAAGSIAQPSKLALYRAHAQTYEGFAQGGDFEVKFFDETVKVAALYESLGEMLCAFVQAELAYIAAYDDEEGPSDADVEQIVAELSQALPMFGPQRATWRMRVEPFDEQEGEFVASQCSVSVPYYVNGKFVQMPCAMGRVTFWPQ